MANTTTERTEDANQASNQLPVIVVDAGKVKRSSVKKLKRGRGKLMAEIEEIVAQVQHELGAEAEGREILPVAVICQKKRKNRRGLLSIID